MDASLLRVIRAEQQRRRAPAVIALSRAAGCLDSGPVELDGRALRRFRNHVGEVFRGGKLAISFACLKDRPLILPGEGHKLAELSEELHEAGLSRSQIGSLRQIPVFGNGVRGFLIFLKSFVAGAILRLALAQRPKRRSQPYFNVIYQYSLLRRQLRAIVSKRYWCVIGDLSPFLIALGGAVKAEGHKLLTWQYGYQDFKRFPAMPDIAIVLNSGGLDLAGIKHSISGIPVFKRKTIDPKPVSWPVDRRDAVGIVLNAFSRSSLPKTIKRIQAHLGCRVLVRPHPRDGTAGRLLRLDGVEIASGESLHEFCGRVDWMICGNTTATLKLRGEGFPVCQFFGFDYFFDDHFAYNATGVVPGFYDVCELSEATLKAFYEDSANSENLDQLLGRVGMDDIPRIDEFPAVFFKVLSAAPSGRFERNRRGSSRR